MLSLNLRSTETPSIRLNASVRHQFPQIRLGQNQAFLERGHQKLRRELPELPRSEMQRKGAVLSGVKDRGIWVQSPFLSTFPSSPLSHRLTLQRQKFEFFSRHSLTIFSRALKKNAEVRGILSNISVQHGIHGHTWQQNSFSSIHMGQRALLMPGFAMGNYYACNKKMASVPRSS